MEVSAVKAILCGDAQVGKTSILLALSGCHEPTSPTMGAGFSIFSINHNDTEIQIRLWDTAGQEVYRSLIRVYFRGAQIVFLVFDVTSITSFQALDGWLEVIHSSCPETCTTLIVANKIDLEDERVVSYHDALQYATANNLTLIEVSAKTSLHLDQLLNSGYSQYLGSSSRPAVVEISGEAIKQEPKRVDVQLETPQESRASSGCC
jgi:small GTP-binding protein